jgi:hypothetical protein
MELERVQVPIASLISKSEKALQKVVPGSWQHTMLRNNLAALRIGTALMNRERNAASRFTRRDLQEALDALAAMIRKAEKAKARFARGTSHHTLQRNRLEALRVVKALIGFELPGEQHELRVR